MKATRLILTSVILGCSFTAALSYNTYQAPLNKFGSVDVNANVPDEQQVIEKAPGFKDPDIQPLSSKYTAIVPTPPMFNVKSYILTSANTGQVLAANNANLRLPPASITKLMLLYIAEQELQNGTIKLSDVVQVPQVAWGTGGSRMFLKPGEQVTVQQLIPGIIVDSGNDAAVTLATHIAGTQDAFVDIMNQKAQALGMTNTHFTDVMGLPAPAHYSSAMDLAILAKAMITEFPQNQSWFSQKDYTFDGIHQYNYNKLLFIYPYADGLKTGSTDSAGFSLVSSAQEPNNTMHLIAVVLNAPSIMDSATFSKSLLTYGFRNFKDQTIYPANSKLQDLRVYDGSEKTIPVGLSQALTVTVPVASNEKITTTLALPKNLEAPIQAGQNIGTIQVNLGKNTIETANVVALANDLPGGWFRKVYDYFAKKA